MHNELLWLGFVLIDFIVALFIFRGFGKIGLFGMIVMNIILCNIQVMKSINLFGFVTTAGNVLYASIFFCTDVLSEIYGKKAARQGVVLGFVFLTLATLYMQITLRFIPSSNDFIQPHMERIFLFLPRITTASLVAFLVSQLHDVWAFHFWKRLTKERYLWVRNLMSTIVSQLIDTVIFVTIAFYGIFSITAFIQIAITTYLIKVIVALLDTPFIYLARTIGGDHLRQERIITANL